MQFLYAETRELSHFTTAVCCRSTSKGVCTHFVDVFWDFGCLFHIRIAVEHLSVGASVGFFLSWISFVSLLAKAISCTNNKIE